MNTNQPAKIDVLEQIAQNVVKKHIDTSKSQLEEALGIEGRDNRNLVCEALRNLGIDIDFEPSLGYHTEVLTKKICKETIFVRLLLLNALSNSESIVLDDGKIVDTEMLEDLSEFLEDKRKEALAAIS